MDLERLDEVRELFKHTLEGSGINGKRKEKALLYFNRVADAHRDMITVLHEHAQHEASTSVVVNPEATPAE